MLIRDRFPRARLHMKMVHPPPPWPLRWLARLVFASPAQRLIAVSITRVK
mgnify:CR=1 FL=1